VDLQGGHSTVRFALSREFSDVPVDRVQWNALVADTADATVFQTYEWFKCWWDAFGGRCKLFLVTAWDGNSLIGMAPLMIRRRAGLRLLEFIGSPNGDYQDFILGRHGAELLPLLTHYLSERRGAWDMIVLRNVPTDSLTFKMMPVLMRSLGLGATDFERVACPTLEISSRPTEIRRLIGGYSFRRRIKKLGLRGDLAFTRCQTLVQLNQHLPQFFEQYVERRRGTAAAAVFGRPDMRAFFTALAESMLTSGWLHFSVLECAGRPVAYHFGFEFGNRLYWYKPSFDPKLASQSPGTVLLSHLIRDSFERGLQELDFTVGAEAFKYRYASTQRTNANLRVFSRRWLYLIAVGVGWARRVAGKGRRALHARQSWARAANRDQA
jgi:CelD/BcsL family acetyltransferase involved in cellulose biosynthesis